MKIQLTIEELKNICAALRVTNVNYALEVRLLRKLLDYKHPESVQKEQA
jgi:hypothetical protein